MRLEFQNLSGGLLSFSLTGPTVRASHAQTYQIDCAIVLCLSGGWPASVPCARARAEFIRRITPGRWSRRCRFGAAPWVRLTMGLPGRAPRTGSSMPYMAIQEPHETFSPALGSGSRGGGMLGLKGSVSAGNLVRADYALQLVEDRADIDISGPEPNFVRSSASLTFVMPASTNRGGMATATAAPSLSRHLRDPGRFFLEGIVTRSASCCTCRSRAMGRALPEHLSQCPSCGVA